MASTQGEPTSATLLCLLSTPSVASTSGRLSISASFLSFISHDKRTRTLIPLYAVRRVERAGAGFILVVWHGMKVEIQPQALAGQTVAFTRALQDNLKSNVSAMKGVRPFVDVLFSENMVGSGVGDAEFDEKEEDDEDQGEEPKEQTAENKITYLHGLGATFRYPGDPKKLKEKTKMKLWREYLRVHGRNLTLLRTSQFQRLVQVGLPNRLRGEMWEVLCGSIYQRYSNPGLYESFLSSGQSKESLAREEIEKDLSRSLPEYPGFQSPDGLAKLRRVLTAYSDRNPELGYCQAMNIVVAAALIYMDEEQSFHLLDTLCTRMLPGYYSPSMAGTLLDQKVLDALLMRTMPILAEHFQKSDVAIGMATLPWFLSLYIGVMPLIFAFRVVDCFMASGVKVLFQIALAILKVNGEELLKATDAGSVLTILRLYFGTLGDPVDAKNSDSKIRTVTHFQELLIVAFREFAGINEDLIEAERSRWEAEVKKGIRKYERRGAVRSLKLPNGFGKDRAGWVYDHFSAAQKTSNVQAIVTKAVSDRKGRPHSASVSSVKSFIDPSSKRCEAALDLESFRVFLSTMVTWARDEKVVRNAFVQRTERTVPNDESEFIKRIFTAWDCRANGLLTFQDCVNGLSKIVANDLMSNISWLFDLHDKNSDGWLSKSELLQVSESLLFIFRSEIGDGYLAAVSKFLLNAFEYADSTSPHERAADPDSQDSPYVSLATFRMVILADELLESFFESDLSPSFVFGPLEVMQESTTLGRKNSAISYMGGFLSNLVPDESKDLFNRFTDEMGKTLGRHEEYQKPSIGKVDTTSMQLQPAVRESIVKNTGNGKIRDQSSSDAVDMSLSSADPNAAMAPGAFQIVDDDDDDDDHEQQLRAAARLLKDRSTFSIDQVKPEESDDDSGTASGAEEDEDQDDQAVMDEVEAFLLEHEDEL